MPLLMRRRRMAGQFSQDPARLFRAGEQSVWYSPNDLTRYMSLLGPELVTNGDFSNGTTGWSAINATQAVAGGQLTVTNVGAAYGYSFQSFATVVGKPYRISLDYILGTATFAYINIGTTQAAVDITQVTMSATGTASFVFVATATTVFVALVNNNNNNATASWDNVSVREVINLATEATMFQDSAGTIPVTGPEQPVGLILDKSGRGNHAYQATSTKRPTLRARYNWLINSATLATQNVTSVAASYKLSFTGTGTVTLSGTSTAGPLVGTGVSDRVSLTFTPTAGTLTLTVSGSVTLADLRLSIHAIPGIPSYQWINAATDYDTVGFPHYLDARDGPGYTANADNAMQTAAIDFSATDKMTVWAGRTHMTGDTYQPMFSLGQYDSVGGIDVMHPSGTSGSIGINMPTSSTVTFLGKVAPATSVITILADRAQSSPGIELMCRQDGVVLSVGSSSGAGVTGMFGSFSIFMFVRPVSGVPFTGTLGEFIIRGAASNASEIGSIERYINNTMGKVF